MPTKTKFQKQWIEGEEKDGSGAFLRDWCHEVERDAFSARCLPCNKVFSVSNMGIGQIKAHAEGKKHKTNMKSMKHQTFFIVKESHTVPNATISSEDGPEIKKTVDLSTVPKQAWAPTFLQDKVTKAETLLILNGIYSNHSFSSFDKLNTIYANAFPDSEIARNITIGHHKVSYILNHGLAPHFKSLMLNDIGIAFFVLKFDETTTQQVKKQMDIYISYWSESWERVISFYCGSEFLGHSEAHKLMSVICDFLSIHELSLAKLLQCSMDGPNVNLSLLRMLNEKLSKGGMQHLIDIGTCSLHILHNGLVKALSAVSVEFDIDTFALDLHQWFKLSAARREDYAKVQLEELMGAACEHMLLRHVSSRWLTLGPVCERIVEQYSSLKKYFLFSESICKKTKESERYKRIISVLRCPTTLVYLNFISSLAGCFIPYLKLFQKEDPQIHNLYSKLNELVQKIFLKFVKPAVIGKKEGQQLVNINVQSAENWLPLKEMDIGTIAKKELDNLCTIEKNDTATVKKILLTLRQSYKNCAEYLMHKLPITNILLQDIQAIHPIMQKDSKSKAAITRLSLQMSKVTGTDSTCDRIKEEWLMYMCEDLTSQQKQFSETQDICKYWADVSKIKDTCGTLKYESLCKMVKACLTLSHGNAGPERGFSINNSILGKDRISLGEKTITSLRIVKDTIQAYGSPSNVPFTKELLYSVKKSHAEYSAYLERERESRLQSNLKRKREEEEAKEVNEAKRRRESIRKKITDFEEVEKNQAAEIDTATQLISEAIEKLTAAGNDVKKIKLCKLMLTAGNEKLSATSKAVEETRIKLKNLREKLDKLI